MRIANPLVCLTDGGKAIDYLSGKGEYGNRELHPYPVLVLLDLKMQGVSGAEVLRWTRDTKQKAKVVVFTGMELQFVRDAYLLGAQSFLHKPVQQEDFERLLRWLPGTTMRDDAAGHCWLEEA